MLEKSSVNNDIGVIIVIKKSIGWIPGSIEITLYRIWIQRKRSRGKSGSGGGDGCWEGMG